MAPKCAIDRPRARRRAAERAVQPGGTDRTTRSPSPTPAPHRPATNARTERHADVAMQDLTPSSRGGEELLRVLARALVGLVGAEHADELPDDGARLELDDGGARRVDRRVLGDREVAVGQGGDLRQVGDAEDLAARRERAELVADRPGGLAADA